MEPYGVIYVLHDTMTGRLYVGQTKNLKRRLYGHRKYGTNALSLAIRKNGWEAFELSIVAHASDAEELDELEKVWIAFLNATDSRVGYNRTLGGNCPRATDEMRRKIGGANRGTKRPDNAERNKRITTGRSPWNKGNRNRKIKSLLSTDERHKRQGDGFRSFISTEDGRIRQSVVASMPWSEEAKARVRERYATPERRAAMREKAMIRWGMK